MTVYYVLEGGTRNSGGYPSVQAISAAVMGIANYYDDIDDVHLLNTLIPGDRVSCFDTHNFSYVANKILELKNGVFYESVSVNDGSVYSPGAGENTSSGLFDFELDSVNDTLLTIRGLSFLSGDQLHIGRGNNSTWVFTDCTFSLTGSSTSDSIDLGQSHNTIIFKNCTFLFNLYGQFIRFVIDVNVEFDNCTFPNITDQLFQHSNGTITVKIKNTDLSTAADDAIIDLISSTNGDNSRYELIRCNIDSGTNIHRDSVTFNSSQKVEAWSINRGTDGNNAWHYFEFSYYNGNILESNTVQRIDGALYDEDDTDSLYTAEFRTTSDVIAYYNPIILNDFINLVLDLTSGATLTFHGVQQDDSFTPSDLTDHQWWIEVTHPESAIDQAFGTIIDSRTTDGLVTPAVLSSSSETFNGTSGNINKQSVSVSIPAMAVTNARISVKMNFAKDLSIADASGASAIEFFACPKPVIT